MFPASFSGNTASLFFVDFSGSDVMSFLNCCNDSVNGLVTQFDVTRFAYGKNDKILAHHYVQSFYPNENITPELAHKIGEELTECVAPEFQIIVATHVDRDNIHNHFFDKLSQPANRK